MGCKCGRDILFGENEIIKAESIRANYDKNKKKESLTINSINNGINDSSIEYNNNNNNDNNMCDDINKYNNNDEKPETNICQNNEEEPISIININGTQRPSFDTNPPINQELSKKNEYPQKIISLINEIRSNPLLYSQVVEESIKNIKITKNNRIIYCSEVKVALYRGKEAFIEAINKLKNTESMPPLRYNPQLCIPLPENEMELNDQNFLKEQVEKIKQRNTNIEIYFKDLIKIPEVSVLLMIVDDNSKNTSKKRDTLLNPNFKFIGVNSKFIGKNFVALFSFSG